MKILKVVDYYVENFSNTYCGIMKPYCIVTVVPVHIVINQKKIIILVKQFQKQKLNPKTIFTKVFSIDLM